MPASAPAATAEISGKEAIRRVLAKAGEPPKTKEIAARALKMRGVRLKGKTPEATLAAILAVETRRPTACSSA